MAQTVLRYLKVIGSWRDVADAARTTIRLGAGTKEAKDPIGPRWGSGRVQRGGSWSGSAPDCRSASRNTCPPSGRHNNYGFRLSCSARR